MSCFVPCIYILSMMYGLSSFVLMFIMRLACPHTITVQLRFVDLHTYFLVVFHWIQLCYVFHLLLCLSLRCFSGSDYAILSTDLHTHVSVAPWYVDPRGDHDSCSRLAHVDTYYPWLIILTCLPLILFVLTTLRVQILPSYFLLIYTSGTPRALHGVSDEFKTRYSWNSWL